MDLSSLAKNENIIKIVSKDGNGNDSLFLLTELNAIK